VELILIEGLPGSGKSTLAESLCNTALNNGIKSNWYLEEAKDHPVHPIEFRSEKHKTSFPEHCIQQWQKFISDNKYRNQLIILEGSLFQSTVRFMMESNNQALISDYFKSCQEILSMIKTTFIYLRPPETMSHIDWVINHRTHQWANKVSEYLQATPYCLERNLQGLSGMSVFWSDYARLCDSLITASTVESYTINAGVGYFETQTDKAIRYSGIENSFNLNQAPS